MSEQSVKDKPVPPTPDGIRTAIFADYSLPTDGTGAANCANGPFGKWPFHKQHFGKLTPSMHAIIRNLGAMYKGEDENFCSE